MIFDKKQINFMKSLGINDDLENPSDNTLFKIDDVIAEQLQKYGFDENEDINAIGLMCESILDSLP